MIDPAITEVLAQLSEITARNTAGVIQTRITTVKSSKQHEVIVGELTEIVNQLVEDRAELIGVANALREQLVAERITPEEIEYITSRLIPAAKNLVALAGEEHGEAIAALEALVSVETLTVLQLVGFNFKAALGQPLTEVVETLVSAASEGRSQHPTEPRTVRRAPEERQTLRNHSRG